MRKKILWYTEKKMGENKRIKSILKSKLYKKIKHIIKAKINSAI